METLKIQCIPDELGRLAPLPEYQTEGAAAMDLRAFLAEPLTLAPMERQSVPTGLAVELPQGFAGLVMARSGLALVNGVGLIDSDYRGEIRCGLINLSAEPFTIRDGDRVAQLLLVPFARAELLPCESLSPTARGQGGFGSTGLK